MVSAAFGCHGFTLVCDFHHKFRKYKKVAPKLPRILISGFVEFFVVLIHRFDVLGVDLHCHKFSSLNSLYFSQIHRFPSKFLPKSMNFSRSTPIQKKPIYTPEIVGPIEKNCSRKSLNQLKPASNRLKPAHRLKLACPRVNASTSLLSASTSSSPPPRTARQPAPPSSPGLLRAQLRPPQLACTKPLLRPTHLTAQCTSSAPRSRPPPPLSHRATQLALPHPA
jgi:hypothetical protein